MVKRGGGWPLEWRRVGDGGESRGLAALGESGREIHSAAEWASVDRDDQICEARRNVMRRFADEQRWRDSAEVNAAVVSAFKPHLDVGGV